MWIKSVFKNSEVELRAKYLCDSAYLVMCEVLDWAHSKYLDPVITETVTSLGEDLALARVSQSHLEGRAFDLRLKDWPENLRSELKIFFESKYGYLGAISKSDNKQNLVVIHGSGDNVHAHFQVKKTLMNPGRLADFSLYLKNKGV